MRVGLTIELDLEDITYELDSIVNDIDDYLMYDDLTVDYLIKILKHVRDEMQELKKGIEKDTEGYKSEIINF